MSKRRRIRGGGGRGKVVLALLIGVVAADPLMAQAGPRSEGSGDPGFLFQRPRVSLGVRAGMFLHRAESDLYEFAEERFTVERSDFRAISFGVEGAAWLGESTEILVGIDGSRVTLPSEYRDWDECVGFDGEGECPSENKVPIRQTTRITHGPGISFGVRRYLVERGEQLSRFVWIPRRWNAFVAGGASISGYEVKLDGDFVDEEEEVISKETFTSDGSVFLPFLAAGAEISVSTHGALVLEGKYHWGDSELGRDFRDAEGRPSFEPLDLSGARVTVGFVFRF